MGSTLDPAFLKAAQENEPLVLEILDALRDNPNAAVQQLITLAVKQHRTDSWPFTPVWPTHTKVLT